MGKTFFDTAITKKSDFSETGIRIGAQKLPNGNHYIDMDQIMDKSGINSEIDSLNFQDGLATRKMSMNSHDMTMNIEANDEVNLQVNQEQVFPVLNLTGVTIPNGSCVRITGHDEGTEYDTIELASNASETTAFVDGILTQELAHNAFGLMTSKGKVRTLNTSGGTVGNLVYLGVNGAYTPTKPTYPAKVIVVGKYGHISATIGEIIVDVSSSNQTIFNDINTELGLRAAQNVGICQKCPILPIDIVIDTTALTISVATIKGGEAITAANPIRFFTDGGGVITAHVKNAPETVAFTNTTGEWYVYWNSSGVMVATQTPWAQFSTIAPIFKFDWNAALSGAARLIEEQVEMHTNTISADAHANQHFGIGTINIADSGILIRNELTTGSPNVDGRNTVVSLTDVTNMDDNLIYTVENVHPATATGYFEQDLGHITAGTLTALNSALLPIRTNNVGGQRSFLPATRFPFAWNTGTNRPEYITSAGVRTLVTDDRYFVYYIYSLQDRKAGQAVRLISAEVDFTTLVLAQAHSIETLQGLYADMRNAELRPLYKLIFLFNNANPSAFDVAVKYTRLHQVIDIRKTKGVAVTSSGGSIPATNVTETTDGNVQTALDNIRANKANLAGATFTGEVQFDKTVIQPSYANTFSSSKTIDMSLGNMQHMPVTGDCSVTLSNLREGVSMLIFTNDSTAGWTITIDSTFGLKTTNSATMSEAANAVNIFTIMKYGSTVLYTIETRT